MLVTLEGSDLEAKRSRPSLFDGEKAEEIVSFFVSNYDQNEVRTASFLVSSFGSKWKYSGRNSVTLRFMSVLQSRFPLFGTEGQKDKQNNLIFFTSTIAGAGKSKANQETLNELKELAKSSPSSYHQLNQNCNFYLDDMINEGSISILLTFVNGKSLFPIEENQHIE